MRCELWVLDAFFTSRIESIVEFCCSGSRLHHAYRLRLWLRSRCVCVPAASTTRLIFTKMDPFLGRERTQTLACSRSSAVCCCRFYSIPIIVGRHNKRFRRRWNGTLWTFCTNRTEQNIDMFIGSTIDKRNEIDARKSLSHTSQPAHSGASMPFHFASHRMRLCGDKCRPAHFTTLINLVYRNVYGHRERTKPSTIHGSVVAGRWWRRRRPRWIRKNGTNYKLK